MSEETNQEFPSEPTPDLRSKSGETDLPEFLSRDAELEQLHAALEQAEKRVLLTQADAENFRKRLRRDTEDQLKFAALPIIIDILAVRENLLRALSAAANAGDSAGLRDGVGMVAKQLDDALAKHSVVEIPALGETFDPNCHEAISQMPSDDYDAGLVAFVAQGGFRMHDRVIRPSQVIVSTGPKTS